MWISRWGGCINIYSHGGQLSLYLQSSSTFKFTSNLLLSWRCQQQRSASKLRIILWLYWFVYNIYYDYKLWVNNWLSLTNIIFPLGLAVDWQLSSRIVFCWQAEITTLNNPEFKREVAVMVQLQALIEQYQVCRDQCCFTANTSIMKHVLVRWGPVNSDPILFNLWINRTKRACRNPTNQNFFVLNKPKMLPVKKFNH